MAVSDLTNTTWVINSLTCTAGYGQFDIVGTTTHQDFNEVSYFYIGYVFSLNDGWVSQANTISFQSDPSCTFVVDDEITITGGTDVTNASLISWLEANATQQTTSTGKTQIGNRAITKKMFGTREITKEVVNGVVVYEKATPSGNTINIIAGREVTDATWGCNTYFKFNSNSVSTSDYDGYVSEYGVLTGPSTYTNVTSMAFVSTTNNMEQSSSVIYGSDSYHFSTSVVVIQINSSGNIYINGLENTGPQ